MNRILFLPDLQIPDHDPVILSLLHDFIGDFKPDHVFLLGDVINFTGFSSFDPTPHYTINVMDELYIAVPLIQKLERVIRKSNPESKITWIKGNHCYRIEKYLARSADQLAEVKKDGKYLVSVEALFDTDKLGIEMIPYQMETRVGNIIVEHGDIVRKHAGYTAKAMFESRGESGISGHTHRLAYYSKHIAGEDKFWIEAGSLCNHDPKPNYVHKPDWENGFVIGYEIDGEIYPNLVPIFNHRFIVNGKLYCPGGKKTCMSDVIKHLDTYGKT